MKLLTRSVSGPTGPANFKVVPEDGEDMWHLYNLLARSARSACSAGRSLARVSAARRAPRRGRPPKNVQ